jgi:threonylcarbamoyladenosine tRNA methylthiotransferase MtaB
MKISILTLGCKVNQAESAFIEENLCERGYSIVPLSEQPDYCIINTCTVTAKSDYQSRQIIRKAVRNGAKAIVTGCYSQLRAEEILNIPGDISIINNTNKLQIINMFTGDLKCNCLPLNGKSRPYIKIQDGCNYACTYCTVPKARGKSESLGLSDILNQALKLESGGYKEIVLTGIHLGSYGRDIMPQLKLTDLIVTILNKTNIHRIRLSSIEMNEVDRELMELMNEDRICKHLHVPLQSGDDFILKRMNRKYSSQEYIRVIETALATVPDIAIGTDVIVGFPGEGDREFLNTKKVLYSLPLSYIHVFPFSPRPDTLASKMSEQIPSKVKNGRVKELNELSRRKKLEYISRQMNTIQEVIVEERIDDQTLMGTAGNYLKIRVRSNVYHKKSLVQVRSTEMVGDYLYGVLIEEP